MIPDVNICDLQGRVVSAEYHLPEERFDYWYLRGPTTGCNAMACRQCGKFLVQRPQYALPSAPDTAVLHQLYAATDWQDFVRQGLLTESETTRLYVCDCSFHNENNAREVSDPGDQYFTNPLPTTWSCAGHKRLSLPLSVDGVALSADVPLAPIVEEGFRATRPTMKDRPRFLRDYQAAWVQRLYRLVRHLPIGATLAEAISKCLSHPDAFLRSCALDFYRRQPDAPFSEKVADLVLDHPELYVGVSDPLTYGEELWDMLLVALAHRAAQSGGQGRELEALHQAALSAHKPPITLFESLLELDKDWLTSHAGAIVKASGLRKVASNLLYLLAPVLRRDIATVVVDIARSQGIPRVELDDLVQQLVPKPFHQAVFDALAQA